MDPVNTIEGLHNLAIPDQIHEETIKDEENDKVFVQDSPAGSLDGLRRPIVDNPDDM